MGLESKLPVMSSLNPNACEFVPAARRVEVSKFAVPVALPAPPPVEEFTDEWWSRFESDEAFKAQVMCGFASLNAEQQDALVEDLAELQDYDQFEGYQEHLVDMEEDEILARNLQDLDCFLDEELNLTAGAAAANGFVKEPEPRKELQQQQQQQQQPAPWSKNNYYANKAVPHKSSALGMATHKRLKLNVSFLSESAGSSSSK